jgi:hypothetical protein
LNFCWPKADCEAHKVNPSAVCRLKCDRPRGLMPFATWGRGSSLVGRPIFCPPWVGEHPINQRLLGYCLILAGITMLYK